MSLASLESSHTVHVKLRVVIWNTIFADNALIKPRSTFAFIQVRDLLYPTIITSAVSIGEQPSFAQKFPRRRRGSPGSFVT